MQQASVNSKEQWLQSLTLWYFLLFLPFNAVAAAAAAAVESSDV